MLVVRDCANGRRVSGLIGTNVLSAVPKITSCLRDLRTKLLVRHLDLVELLAHNRFVYLPNPLTMCLQLEGEIVQLPSLNHCHWNVATDCARTFPVAVLNRTHCDMWLKPLSRLGILRPAQVFGTRNLHVDVNNSDIIVTSRCSTTSHLTRWTHHEFRLSI